MQKIVTSLLLVLMPALASARVYTADHLPFNDAPQDRDTAVALSLLSEEGIVHGHPDGTFRAHDHLNRAEFMKIVMGIKNTSIAYDRNCFPDVPADTWFNPYVCKAKVLGIVSGNEIAGVPADQWLFEPNRQVLYSEAVKILTELYEIQPTSNTEGEWYQPYMDTSSDLRISLPGKGPAYRLRRGDMAQLVASYYAFDDDTLEDLRTAQSREVDPPPVVDVCEDYICADGSMHPGCTEDGHVIQYLLNPCHDSGGESTSSNPAPTPDPVAEYDTSSNDDTSSNFLLLGDTSAVLAAGKIFLEVEPLNVEKIMVTLVSANGSISHFNVYNENGMLLGKAYLDTSVSNKTYTLNVKTQSILVPAAEEFSFYVRGILKDKDTGGVSGVITEVSNVSVSGNGDWSNRTYTRGTNESYNTFQTARSIITEISNASDDNGPLIEGPDQELASFRFGGEKGDSSADLRVTDINFRVSQINTSVTNIQLSADQTGDRMNCGLSSGVITCSSIDEIYGSFEDRPRILTLYGDVTVSTDAQKASLNISINNPGSPGVAGDVTWTDGTTNFTWVPGNTPVARGTYWSY